MKRKHAFRYNKHLKDVVQHIPEELTDRRHVYHLYSILSNRREELREYLNDVSVESLIHWKIPVNEYPFLTQVNSKTEYPYIAKQISEQTLSLPCHPFLREDEQDYIIEHVKKFYEET